MSLGRTIRQRREEAGMSQAYLADTARLSQGYVSQIENEEVSNPSAAVIFRLAQALHLDPRCLLQAAGYTKYVIGDETEGIDTSVDPDLLRFLARLSPEQHQALFRFLKELEQGAIAGMPVTPFDSAA